jgi:hypothetical protein
LGNCLERHKEKEKDIEANKKKERKTKMERLKGIKRETKREIKNLFDQFLLIIQSFFCKKSKKKHFTIGAMLTLQKFGYHF